MSALKKKKPTFKAKAGAWLDDHNRFACLAICLGTAALIIGLFAFVVFSDFGGSADFIYNQF